MPGKRRTISNRDMRAICDRLRDFVQDHYHGWAELERRLHVPKSTHVQWTRKKDPTIPEVPYLLAIAQDSKLSLDWLLFGEGAPLRTRSAITPEGQALAAVESELRRTTDATQDELDDVWSRLVIYRTTKHGFRAAFQMAVEGLRPLYDDLLRQVRWAEDLLAQGSRMSMQTFREPRWTRDEIRDVMNDFARQVAAHIVRREEERGLLISVPATSADASASEEK